MTQPLLQCITATAQAEVGGAGSDSSITTPSHLASYTCICRRMAWCIFSVHGLNKISRETRENKTEVS